MRIDSRLRKSLSKESAALLRQSKKLQVVDGILVRKTNHWSQIVLPKKYHNLVYQELHVKLGHMGSERVFELARKRFYWAHMRRDVDHFIRKQCRCVISKAPNEEAIAPLKPIVSTYPFEMVSIDYMQLDVCKGNFKYALVVIDHFTKFVQIYATKNKKGITAADKVFNGFILKYGFPSRIHHDQGGEFENELFTRLHQLTGIDKSRTTPYHPSGNGQTERMNRTLISMLKTLEEKEKQTWKDHLDKLAFAYNVTTHKSTSYSPFFLVFGREPSLPIDTMFASVGEERLKRKSYDEYASEWQRSMEQAFAIVRENTSKKRAENEKQYNKKARGVEIVEGDKVLLRNDNEKRGTGKLKNYWEKGVYIVEKKHDDLPIFTIKSVEGKKIPKIVHRNRLMPCNSLLPEPEEETVLKAKKMKPKPKQIREQEVVQLVPAVTEGERESDSEDELILIEEEIDESTNIDRVPPTMVESDDIVEDIPDMIVDENEHHQLETERPVMDQNELEESLADDSLGSENTLLNNSEADDTFESVNESVSAVDGANFSVSSDGNDTTTPNDDETALIQSEGEEEEDDEEEEEQTSTRPRRQVAAPRDLTYNEFGAGVWERRVAR